ncbi:MAG: hypothetical protein LBD32_01775 [Cytophagales bacterium]|nr:hypothetical protein [Cytophagales bacterium]
MNFGKCGNLLSSKNSQKFVCKKGKKKDEVKLGFGKNLETCKLTAKIVSKVAMVYGDCQKLFRTEFKLSDFNFEDDTAEVSFDGSASIVVPFSVIKGFRDLVKVTDVKVGKNYCLLLKIDDNEVKIPYNDFLLFKSICRNFRSLCGSKRVVKDSLCLVKLCGGGEDFGGIRFVVAGGQDEVVTLWKKGEKVNCHGFLNVLEVLCSMEIAKMNNVIEVYDSEGSSLLGGGDGIRLITKDGASFTCGKNMISRKSFGCFFHMIRVFCKSKFLNGVIATKKSNDKTKIILVLSDGRGVVYSMLD